MRSAPSSTASPWPLDTHTEYPSHCHSYRSFFAIISRVHFFVPWNHAVKTGEDRATCCRNLWIPNSSSYLVNLGLITVWTT